MAFTKNIRTFDNHLTDNKNKLAMNYNNIKHIFKSEYYKKYPFSTLLTIMSVYDIPLPDSKEGKILLLSIDTAFKGHYASKKIYTDIHNNWLETLGYSELIDILEEKESSYFYNIINHFKLNSSIWICENGQLDTEIKINSLNNYFDYNIELPQQEFKLVKELERDGHLIGEKDLPMRDRLISLAYTSKNYVSYTYDAS
ncbi:hypothetical protein [Bacillus massiliigorillae]|uniref:hypothetical protein n=1 Tax=Bacillus massiliigorillae TaxID=1243664 RepID=UPI0012B547C1|nr:hypothetical protein [Bacillus massiliigorillae]